MADTATLNNMMQVLSAKANEQLKLTRFFRYNAQAKHGVPQDGVDAIKYERTETIEQPPAPPPQPEPQPQPPQPVVTIPEKIEIVCPERPAPQPPTIQPQPPPPRPEPPVSTQPVHPPFPNWMKFLLALLPLLALLALILWMIWPQPGTPVTPVDPIPPVTTPQQAESALQYLEDTGYHLP